MLFTFLRNWSLYTGISFLTCLATTLPIARGGISILLVGYGLYGVANTFQYYSNVEREGHVRGRQAMIWSISANAPDFIYLLFAIIVGIYLGTTH